MNLTFNFIKLIRLTSPLKVNTPSLYRRLPHISSSSSIRLFNAQSYPSRDVTFNEVKKIGTDKSNNYFIIDVRKPEELKETGVIPGSLNVPLDELESSLNNLSDKQFEKRFGRQKPTKDSLIIFSCRSGVRSLKALAVAEQLGYKQLKNYAGGWLDWEEQTKK